MDDSDGSSSNSGSEQDEGSPTVDDSSTTQTPAESSAQVTSPGAAKKAEKTQPKVPGPLPHAETTVPPPRASVLDPLVQAQNVPSPPQGVAGSAVVSIMESFRVASGLAAFVAADACTRPTLHATVTVGANGAFAPGEAKMSLAPDPAHATVGISAGSLSVTVYACE
ncbi:hypothetical protein ACX3O0_01040 [Homoserinimonas sp. A447]